MVTQVTFSLAMLPIGYRKAIDGAVYSELPRQAPIDVFPPGI